MKTYPGVERAGIYKRLPRIKTYLAGHDHNVQDWETAILPRLQRYVHETGFAYGHSEESAFRFTYDFNSAQMDLDLLGVVKTWGAVRAALGGDADWLEQWREAVAYRHWETRMDLHFSEYTRREVKAGKRAQPSTLFLRSIGATIGDCVALGWLDWAEDLAARTRAAMDSDNEALSWLFNDAGDGFGRRRTQHFVLRLVADWKGWAPPARPRCAFDDAILNALIEHWRTQDLDTLAYLLLAACDRHTQQCRFDSFSQDRFYDLCSNEYWYDPFEILAVLRLREHEGLPNPRLEHPLLATALGELAPLTHPYSDDLLEGVLAQARRQEPGF